MASTERVVAFDVALSTGYAEAERDPKRKLGAKLLDHGVLKIKYKGAKRFGYAFKLYCDLIERKSPSLVVLELVDFAKFRKAYASYCSLRALILLACDKYGVPVVEVNVKTLKSFWTGNGNASKTDMCKAVRKKTAVKIYSKDEGGPTGDEDRADAIAAAFWALKG